MVHFSLSVQVALELKSMPCCDGHEAFGNGPMVPPSGVSVSVWAQCTGTERSAFIPGGWCWCLELVRIGKGICIVRVGSGP